MELPKEFSRVDFEYSGWENISSHPVLDSAATCIYDEFHLSNFYLEPKDQVEHTAISKKEHEFKIPGLFMSAMSMETTLPSYKINVNYRYDNSKIIGFAEDCILSIKDKVNITHSKSELKCKTKGEKTVQFFPTIASNIENEIKVYLHISEIFSLDDSSFLCHKATLLSVFLFFVLF